MRIVHEGRGGFIEIDGERYPIEHVEGGRFCVHFSGRRSQRAAAHLAALHRLVVEQPQVWAIVESRVQPTRAPK